MGFLTPTNRPHHSLQPRIAPVKSELSQEEWISSFLLKGALRTRLRSLPMFWMIVVSVVIFPIGLWNQMDSAGRAEEFETAEKSKAASKTIGLSGQAEDALQPAEVEITIQPDTPRASLAPILAPNRITPPLAKQSDSGLPVLPNPDLQPTSDSRKLRVTILVSGRVFSSQITVPAAGAKVRHAIEAMNFKLDTHDRVFPVADAPVYDGLKIRITRVRVEMKNRQVAVESNLRFRPTAALRPGAQKIEEAGQAGTVEVSERVWIKDGKVSLREVVGKKTIREAKDKVVAVGARPYYMPGKIPYHKRYAAAYKLASRSGSPRDRVQSNETKTLRPIKSIMLTATGYSPDPRENGGYTTTATGLPISYGAAAVDPRVIPLGTKMYVEGYGYAFACDTGGAIKGNRIDLAYDSYRLANTKGRKKVRVWILSP